MSVCFAEYRAEDWSGESETRTLGQEAAPREDAVSCRSSSVPSSMCTGTPSCPGLWLTHRRGMGSDAKSWTLTFTLECRSYWDMKLWISCFLGCICFLVRCTLSWMGESHRAKTANFLLERKELVRRQWTLSVCKEYLSEMISQSKKQKQYQELA